MKEARKLWTRYETVLAVELYCRTPFGKIHNRNPEIIALAQKIGRTPSSVALKLSNFASLDPTLDRKGMGNHSKLDAQIWAEFFENPDLFLENTLKAVSAETEEYVQHDIETGKLPGFREGGEYEVITKARKNQNYFRQMVLASYNGKCAITGIDLPEVLVASHIVPWATNSVSRTDPRNGICLNALHDKAFDRGLISLDNDCRVLVSKKLSKRHEFFDNYEGQTIALPDRFLPDPEFIKHHRENIFIA